MSPLDPVGPAEEDRRPRSQERPKEFESNSRSATTNGGQRSSKGEHESDLRPHSTHGDDLRLVAAALRGDEAAVEALVTRMVCIPRVIKALDKVRGGALGTAGRDDAEQEARLRIWRDLRRFHGSSKLETWMYQYCFNVYRESIRRRNSSGGSFPHATSGDLDRVDPGRVNPNRREPVSPDVLGRLEQVQQKQILWRAIDGLPQNEKDAVTLKHVDDLSFAEMASVTGVSINTLKARYYRACRAIKSLVDRAADAGPYSGAEQ